MNCAERSQTRQDPGAHAPRTRGYPVILTAAAILVTAGLFVACGSGTVPRAAPTATAMGSAPPPPCRGDQLTAGAPFFVGATGSQGGGLRLWNTSNAACRLTGTPIVAIRDASGQILPVANQPAPDRSAAPFTLPARQTVPASPSGDGAGAAAVEMQWFNWCGDPESRPLTFVLTLSSADTVQAPTTSVRPPRCDDMTKGSWINVAPFVQVPSH